MVIFLLCSMPRPSLCIIFEAIGDMSGIGKVAFQDVVNALQAGYRITVVAQQLDPRLRRDVEWLPLYVPPRFFLLKWATARHFMERAIGGRRFNLIHSHQPQAASMSDVFTCHFLTRVAYERKCLERGTSTRAQFVRLQQQGVLRLEDRCYRHWNPRTRMIFCSDLLRDEFNRLYRPQPAQTVIDNACPAAEIPTAAARSAARAKLLGGDTSLFVVGYLGGLDERKGYRPLLAAVRNDPALFLLMGGPSSDRVVDSTLSGRMKACGQVRDLDTFYAACDVVAVPSVFDPCPMVVLETVARGIPVIATNGVGNLRHLLRTGAGAEWTPGESLGEIVAQIMANKDRYRAGAARMTEELSIENRARRVLETYDEVLRWHGRPAHVFD